MRVKPFIAWGLLAGALALPGPVMALGLGKLTVQSSLGQPLSARIELTSASKEELDSLSAKVADPALYRQNNLAYQGVLARSRVTLERGANGQAHLVVTTQGAIGEPYLDLMVELNWASGRLVREYTFLLDPPGVAAPPVEPVAPLRAGAAPTPRPASAGAGPTVAPVAPAAATRASSEGEGYAVKRGDTLSKIASEHKPQNVTLEQMLVAIFKTNQGAFEGSNINRLRAGSIITIPGAEEATATPPPEATKVVRMQAADWRAYRDRVAATAPGSDGAGSRGAGGKIGTVVEETVPAAPPGRDQLKVSRANEPGKDANAAAEETIARSKQIKEAQDRIAELEKTVRDLQRAAELKSQALAMLQAQAESAQAQPQKVAASATAPEPKGLDPMKVAPAKPGDTPKSAEPVKAAESSLSPSSKPEEAPKMPPKSAVKAETAPKSGSSFFADVMTSTPTWAIGVGALALLAGIAALLAARRRKTSRYEDGITTDTDIKTNTVFGSTGGGVVNTGENSLSSEFSREGLGNIDTDEVDPIAEAEVYLAYGRDAQAEEILKDALKKDRQRQEIYLKLLEIHAQHNKPSAFETVAAELYAVSHGEGEVWPKAVALGRQLDPNNPMFAVAGSGTGAAASGDAHAFSVPSDLKLDPPAASGANVAANDEHDNVFDRSLDEDIALSSSVGHPQSPSDILAGARNELEKRAKGADSTFARTAAAAATAALVSGMAKTKATRTGEGHESEAVEYGAESTGFGSDLDFHLDESEKPVPMHVAASEAALTSAGLGVDPAAQHAPTQAPIELDKLDFTFDDDRSKFEDATPSVLDGQWHDAATKLDLAKAYQEMGDVEGAREILREVLAEGDDGQKTEAQAIIAKLG